MKSVVGRISARRRIFFWEIVSGRMMCCHAKRLFAIGVSATWPLHLSRWGEIDAFRNEAVAYALGFMKAHVPCKLHVIGGVTHILDTFPMPIADRAFEYRSYVISQL